MASKICRPSTTDPTNRAIVSSASRSITCSG
jgi:hypothetical protein